MASEELVTEQFQFLGIDVQKEVLSKCASLCSEYDVDAESFTEQWMAFSLNHLNGASPDLENLDLFARKEFSKRSSSRCNASAKDTTRAVTGTSLAVYGTPSSNQSDNDVLCNYIAVTPKRVKKEPDSGGTPQNDLRPATYSPTVGSTKYSSRTNMGTVVHSYGDENLLQVVAKPTSLADVLDLKITQVPNDDGEVHTKALCRFGFALLHETAALLGNHMRYISQHIMKKAGITDCSSVRHKTQTEVAVAGRIECDADARLNMKSVVLQGTWAESLYQAVPVDIDNLKQYSLFPGQVVVMKGINPRGDKFIAHEVLCDASLPIPDHKADMMNTLIGNLSMLISAGPYTTSDNMNFEPLKDLIMYISTNKPHLVIMTGPFMDCEHSMIADMAETFTSFFDKIIDNLADISNTSPNTKVYIVSSSKDAFKENIYPTPPYTGARKHTNIHFVSDPCTLNVNGMVIGVTSCDVLMQISQEEISSGIAGDKLSRLSRHVISQQTYSPVWPPGAQCVDSRLWAAHAQLACTPHLLVLPSNFRYFVKNVDGCVVINPEHLTKGTGGGTFARVLVSGGKEQDLNIAAQIVRI